VESASSSDLDRLKAVYADWSRGDFTRSDFMHREIEGRTHGSWPDARSDANGIEELAAGTGGFLAAWERPFTIEAEEYLHEGDRFLVLIRWHGRGKESGVQTEAEGAHLWTFRGGLAVRFETYRDRAEAREALSAG
jgi:ketosteroid isomerase-like protein